MGHVPWSLRLSFNCIPQSTHALDQGGVEPRQAVSPRPGGQGRYRFATASAAFDGCLGRCESCRFACAILPEVFGPVIWRGALQFAPGAESFFGASFFPLIDFVFKNSCIDWISHRKSGFLIIGSAVEDLDLRSVAVPFEDLCICSSRFAR